MDVNNPEDANVHFSGDMQKYHEFQRKVLNKSGQLRSTTSGTSWSISFVNGMEYSTYKIMDCIPGETILEMSLYLSTEVIAKSRKDWWKHCRVHYLISILDTEKDLQNTMDHLTKHLETTILCYLDRILTTMPEVMTMDICQSQNSNKNY